MVDIANQIITILNQAERSLQEVIAEAAKAADYHNVGIARLAALEMDKLSKRVKGPPIVEKPQDSQPSQLGTFVAGNRLTGKRRSPKSAYPKFSVRNGTLSRIAWSKKKRGEYTHRAPKAVFDQTITAMASLFQTGNGSFMAEHIIERVASNSPEHVPSYQVYLVINLLSDSGCIQKVGREGYRWPEQLEDNARKVWAEFAEGELD